MEAWGASSHRRNVASNACPRIMLYLGEQYDEGQISMFRSYWRTGLQGQGIPGIWGGSRGKPAAIDLKPSADQGLYLEYQKMLVRVFAFAFNLKPQDSGVERDVNRSQGEVS